MPDIPQAAITAAAAAIERELMSGKDYSMTADSDEALARAALDAAAPVLAEAVAQKILAHMNEHIANPGVVRLSRAAAVRSHMARMHFSTAVRIAAGAFDTREDQLRMTAEAIERGDFVACDIPEVPRRAAPPASDRGARIVACPKCGADAGVMCRTVTMRRPDNRLGYEMSTSHAARKRAAVAADIPEVPGVD